MILMPWIMQNIEREHLRAQAANAPAGHAINGPHLLPPFWHCSCGLEWSAGTHPDQDAARIAERDQSTGQAEPSETERALQYPYSA